MKVKRLFAGLLAAVITASAVLMSGCSGGNSEENSANTTSTRKIVTLNMYVITDEKTDLDNAREVQMDINHILLPQYKTMLKINYLTEDEYWDTLESVQKSVEHYREYGEVLSEETAADETAAADENAAADETQNSAAEETAPSKDDFSDLINGTDDTAADQTQTDNTADTANGVERVTGVVLLELLVNAHRILQGHVALGMLQRGRGEFRHAFAGNPGIVARRSGVPFLFRFGLIMPAMGGIRLRLLVPAAE